MEEGEGCLKDFFENIDEIYFNIMGDIDEIGKSINYRTNNGTVAKTKGSFIEKREDNKREKGGDATGRRKAVYWSTPPAVLDITTMKAAASNPSKENEIMHKPLTPEPVIHTVESKQLSKELEDIVLNSLVDYSKFSQGVKKKNIGIGSCLKDEGGSNSIESDGTSVRIAFSTDHSVYLAL